MVPVDLFGALWVLEGDTSWAGKNILKNNLERALAIKHVTR